MKMYVGRVDLSGVVQLEKFVTDVQTMTDVLIESSLMHIDLDTVFLLDHDTGEIKTVTDMFRN